MPTTMRAAPLASLRLLALAASLATWPAAQAEERPWYIGASQVFTHDDNIFRNSGAKTSDTISSTGVLGGLNWTPGRQRIYLDANAANNRYGDLESLNNTSYSVSTGLNWQTVQHLSGHLRYSSRQSLTDFTVVGAPEAKDIEKSQVASAGIRFGFTSALGVHADAEHRKLDLSVSDYRDTTQDMAALGVRWGGGGQLSFGVAGRATKGETPLYQPILPLNLFPEPTLGPVEPDEMDRQDIDFTATWVPSGLSTINARISLSSEEHTAPSRSDFEGVTGAVIWDYKPTGKTTIRSSLVRDTGDETSFLQLTQIGFEGLHTANNRVNWITQVAANWEATAKIVVNAALRHNRGEVETITGAGFNSSTTRVRLGANYQITRTVGLGCSVSHERGSSSSFSANVASCFGRFVLR